MEAATEKEKKRGRPDIFATYYEKPEKIREFYYLEFSGLDKRSFTNMFYVLKGLEVADATERNAKQYFYTDRGKYKYKAKGIAEQLGRMYFQNGYDIELCKKVCEIALQMIDDGLSVKTVERWIRTGRNTNTW